MEKVNYFNLLNVENGAGMNYDDYNNELPTSNFCGNMLSSECLIKKDTNSYHTLTHSCDSSPRMEKESENCSVNNEDNTLLTDEYDITKNQHINIGTSNSYGTSNDNIITEEFVHKKSTKNGLVKRNSKRKKISNGPVRGRPRKALVAMYHSQISGDKNAIKIRIKKSSFSSQVSFLNVIHSFSQIEKYQIS